MEKININYDIKLLKEYYNDAYHSYLNNISPLIFMNDFLEKLIKLTSSKSGYIMSICNYDNETFLVAEAINKNIFNKSEFFFLENNMINLNIESIITNVAKTGIHILSNNVKEHELYKEPLRNFTEINTYVSYPIKYLNKIIGVIGLTDAPYYDENILVFLEEVSYLLSILINNYLDNTKQVIHQNRFISYQLMDEIMNKTNDGIIIIDNKCKILYYNHLGFNFIQNISNDTYTSDFLNKNIIDLVSQFDFLISDNNKENKVFKNKKINLELNNFQNNLIYYNILLNSVISNNNINHIFLISHNETSELTSKKTHNNLIAFLSHELRNPLQSLTMATYLLQKKINLSNILNDEKSNIYLNTISKSSNEMKRIINDILDLSKIESDDMELILDNYKIEDIIKDLCNTFYIYAKEKNIELKYLIDSNSPKFIFTDLTRITQILSNLVSNAIKYSNKSSEVLIKVIYNKKDHGVNFNIIDQGMGISKDQYHNLFKENGKTTNSYKFDVKSNGFGLYLSQKIAHLLDGHISFKSQYNEGSVFTLFHPIKLGMSINNIKNKVFTKIIEGKILLVDDDLSNLNMFRLLLENIKFEYDIDLEINTINCGESAIELCKINNYDLIFMDINMTGIDGCTATKIIKENYLKNNIKVQVIATTGNIMAKKENQNLSSTNNKYLCFDNILIKPYDEETIISLLNSYLEKN